ncbi:hypothetical protein HMI56_005906 [Coelomomyces lativittatus]|nr:hypothetical protein HMI56_005906 [Coelomomyces lativittatus]
MVEEKKDVENTNKELQLELQKNTQCKSGQSEWDSLKKDLEMKVSSLSSENDNLKTNSLSMHQNLETIQSKLDACNKLKNQPLEQLNLIEIDHEPVQVREPLKVQSRASFSEVSDEAPTDTFLNSNPSVKQAPYQFMSSNTNHQTPHKVTHSFSNQNRVRPGSPASRSQANSNVHFSWTSSWSLCLMSFMIVFYH